MDRLKKPIVLFPLLLVLTELILFIANYKPGTFLIGWDNVMPEFDIKANFIRSIFSIWQEYRGLGVLDGLAHSANLLHTIYIFLLSTFLPQSMLRYAFIHLTHIAGGLGFFFLLRKFTKNDKASFLGSLFYMFNLAVIQMYFAPLEVFATHFAALPILALLITNTLERFSKKNVFLLSLASILLSQQGFVPTVFIAFSVLLGFMLLTYAIFKRSIKRVILVLLVVIAANAFWALPYSYSALHTGTVIKESRINQFSSEEIFYRNKTFGDLPSVLSLKGFMIDTIELDPNTFKDDYFMSKWRDLSSSLAYNIIYITFFALALLGAGLTIIKRKMHFLPYLLTLLTAMVFLGNDTPVLSQINEFIRTAFPLIGEAFRFPFTKFITLFAFCLSVLMTFGLSYLLSKIKRQTLAALFFLGAILFISYPAFTGNFTSPYLKQKLPQDYLALFKEMQTLPANQRVALFPVQTFWNWQYRSWGQRGSGFIWHGIPQPILERAFDPWSPYDEQFYNEIAYAVNTQDETLFENVIKKYDIKYIVLDQYVLNTLSKKEVNYDSLKKFLEQSKIVREKARFNKVILYETSIDNQWIYSLNPDNTSGVYPNYSFEKEDSIYGKTSNYITDNKNPSVINLFPSLYSQKTQEDLEFNVQNNRDEYILTPKKSLTYDLQNYALRIPSMFETEFLVPVKVEFGQGEIILTSNFPKININGKEIQISEEPIILTPQIITNPTSVTFIDINQTVRNTDKNAFSYLLNPAVNSIKLTDNAGDEELIYLDTKDLVRKPTYVSVPEGGNASVSIAFPKITSSLSAENVIENNQYEIKRSNQGPFTAAYSKVSSTKGLSSVDLSAMDGASELTFYKKSLYHQGNYILFAKNYYQSGLPMRFYVDNDIESKAEVEAVFSKQIKDTIVVIPKSTNYFQGYGFHFIVKSVGKEQADSSISSIELYPFPASFVRSLQFVKQQTLSEDLNSNPKIQTEFRKINSSLYEAYANPNDYLVLSQAFDKGWAAYEIQDGQPASPAGGWSMVNGLSKYFPFLFGHKLKTHILVNNWANGWKTENGGDVIIVYLPEYIQYLGQFVTVISFIGLIIWITKRRTSNNKKEVYIS